MNDLARPFVTAWEWVGRTGGFPGQVLAVVATIMLVIGVLTWVANKK
jgi:hypothetical protein